MLMEVAQYQKMSLSGKKVKDLASIMTSWRTVYAAMSELEDSTESLDRLAEMLAWESHNKDGPRYQLLSRIHMRLNAMRQRLEHAELLKVAKR